MVCARLVIAVAAVIVTISELAMQAKADAALVVDRHVNPSQKKASLALYGVLGSCMLLCERCERDPAERAELDRLFAEQPKEGVTHSREINRLGGSCSAFHSFSAK